MKISVTVQRKKNRYQMQDQESELLFFTLHISHNLASPVQDLLASRIAPVCSALPESLLNQFGVVSLIVELPEYLDLPCFRLQTPQDHQCDAPKPNQFHQMLHIPNNQHRNSRTKTKQSALSHHKCFSTGYI
jgi:hypothetical protein